MIIQFSVSNYRCFREIQTLNLTAGSDRTLPENCISTDLPGLANRRWLKGVGLYGANASGKSTVLDALNVLIDLVINSAKTTDAKTPIIQIDPFALRPERNATPTGFAIIFISDGVRYEYRVAATRERIWHESLRAFPSAREQLWYSREWNPGTSTYLWAPERPTGFRRDPQLESYTLSNGLFLSKAVANNRTELEPVFRWFKRLLFLNLSAGHLPFETTLNQFQTKSPLMGQILELLRHADLGVADVGVIEKPPTAEALKILAKALPPELRENFDKEKWFYPQLLHSGAGVPPTPLPWETESAGTKRFFALAGLWLDILDSGRVVCIDEIETSMHPLMVRELLRLFMNAQANSKGAQIIFTTHNPLLLDITLLRRDQVWFTDKDDEGAAHLYPLTDYSPRKGESLVRGYLAGRYGAVPFIPAGLLGVSHSNESMLATKRSKNG